MTRSNRTPTPIQPSQPSKLQSRVRSRAGSTKSPSHRAQSRKGYALASPSDRKRLRERNVAERVRVEKMLANVPVSDERRARPRDPEATAGENRFLAMGPAISQPDGCPVCGDARILTDEVIHSGTLSMSECLHCDHRWTTRPKTRWVDLGARMNRGGRPRAAATA